MHHVGTDRLLDHNDVVAGNCLMFRPTGLKRYCFCNLGAIQLFSLFLTSGAQLHTCAMSSKIHNPESRVGENIVGCPCFRRSAHVANGLVKKTVDKHGRKRVVPWLYVRINGG